MARITIGFPNPINVSVNFNPDATFTNTLGADIAYYSTTTSIGGFDTAGTLVEIGPITAATLTSITCDMNPSTAQPAVGVYISFAKDNRANVARILGYYGYFRFTNDDNSKISELYSVGADYFESSK